VLRARRSRYKGDRCSKKGRCSYDREDGDPADYRNDASGDGRQQDGREEHPAGSVLRLGAVG
jgi:hypothetical protein